MSQLSYILYLIPHTASLSHTFSNHQVTEGMARTELTNKLTIRKAALLASRYSSLGEPVCSSLGPTGRWKLLNIRVNICKETSEIIIHIAIVCDQQSHGSIYSVAGNFRGRKLSWISWVCGYWWKFVMKMYCRNNLLKIAFSLHMLQHGESVLNSWIWHGSKYINSTWNACPIDPLTTPPTNLRHPSLVSSQYYCTTYSNSLSTDHAPN